MNRPPARHIGRREEVAAVADLPAAPKQLSVRPFGTEPPPDLSGDLLFGAAAIAEFLFGTEGERRKVYALIDSGSLPVFRWGTTICARKSTILSSIAEREAAAAFEIVASS